MTFWSFEEWGASKHSVLAGREYERMFALALYALLILSADFIIARAAVPFEEGLQSLEKVWAALRKHMTLISVSSHPTRMTQRLLRSALAIHSNFTGEVLPHVYLIEDQAHPGAERSDAEYLAKE